MSELNFLSILQKFADDYIDGELQFPKKMTPDDQLVVTKAIQTRIQEIGLQPILQEYELFKTAQSEKGAEASLAQFYTQFDLAAFSKEYPVLDTIVKREVVSLNVYLQEIFDHFETVKKEYSLDSINGIKLSMGDRHNNGRFVCSLTIDGEEWMYKPRSGEIDRRFHEYLASKLPNYSFKIYSDEQFSLHKKIEWQECTEEGQVEQVYFELGYISAIFYFLSSTDMHYENMIVSGAHPYFIDLETITDVASSSIKSLYTQILTKSTGNVLSLLSDSLLNSNVFPYSLDGKEMDISALFGRGQTLDNFYYNSYQLEDFASENVRLVEVLPTISDEKNQVMLNGETVDIFTYYPNIIEGFKQFCQELLLDKQKVEKELLSIIENVDIRQVLRATHVYYHFLTTSYGPYYLTSVKRRNKLFSILDEASHEMDQDYGAAEKNKEEITILETDNIPIFFCEANSRDLYSSNGFVVSDFFGESPINKVQRKIREFSKEVMDFQLGILESSLFLGFSKQDRKETRLIETNITQTNEEIVTHFLSTLIEKEDEIYSIIPSEYGKNYLLTSLNSSIYESGGIILTLLFMAEQLQLDEAFFVKILKGITGQKLYFPDLLSGFSGIGSYIYINLLLWEKYHSQVFSDNIVAKVEDTLDGIETMNEDNSTIDFVNGLSSLLVVLQEVYTQNEFPIDAPRLKESLSKVAHVVIAKAKKEKLQHFGFAHGLSGIIYGLAKANTVLEEDDIFQDICYFLEIEEAAYSEEEENYFDDKNQTYASYYYCYGLPGILLTRMKLSALGIPVDKEQINERLRNYAKNIYTGTVTFSDYSLCHGIGGTIELFEEAYQKQLLSKNDYEHMMNQLQEAPCVLNGEKLPFRFQNFMLGEWSKIYKKLRAERQIPSFLYLETINKKIQRGGENEINQRKKVLS